MFMSTDIPYSHTVFSMLRVIVSLATTSLTSPTANTMSHRYSLVYDLIRVVNNIDDFLLLDFELKNN